jgi:protein-S-isoprenylcysteine O-methyltransferase Ste14
MFTPHASESAALPLPAQTMDSTALRRVQLKRKAILAGVILVFLVTAAITRPLVESSIWNEVLVATGQIALFGAIVGRSWCSLYIGGRKTREIVTLGPYSVSRNPLYLFSSLAAFGVGALTGSVVLLIAAVALTFLVLRATVQREEAWLTKAFGAPYEAYLKDTPRFWPRWSIWRDEPSLEIDPARFVRTVLDGSVLLLALPLLKALVLARAEGVIPTLIVLP